MTKTKRGSIQPPKNKRRRKTAKAAAAMPTADMPAWARVPGRRKASAAVDELPPSKSRRVMMALRVTPTLHDDILRRVEHSGRSITQEMELLLEQALFTERAIGAPGGAAWHIAHDTMVRMLRAVIDWERETGKRADLEPLYYPEIYRRAMIYAIEGLAAHWPGHPSVNDIEGAINEARERIAANWKERDQK